jgi:PPM family protein phosphatase
MSLAVRYSAVSDVGRVRSNNQDSGFAGNHLLMVADGMGGAAAGDLASATTVQIMRRIDQQPPDDMLEALAGAIHRANVKLGELIDDDASVEGMGTTVTAMLFNGERVALAHIGDSRAYLLRDGELSQLTRDHTFVQGLVDEGRITAAEARTHPHRNLIMKVLDGRHEVEPDLTMLDAQPGDRMLLCSDGLTGVLDDDAMRDMLREGSPDSVALTLVNAALEGGANDNVTCVVFDVVDADTPIDEDSAAAALGPLLVGAAAEQARGRISDTAAQPAIRDGHDEDPVDRELLRYAPRPPRRFAWLRGVLIGLAVLALLAVGAVVAYNWSQEQYYVTDDGDTVAVYRGIDAQLPLVRLSNRVESSQIELDDLTPYWRDQVTAGIDADSLDDARSILTRLNDVAARCRAEQSPSPSPSPTESPRQPTESPTSRPRQSPEPTGTSSPTSSPATPSPTGTAGANYCEPAQ